MARPDIQAAVTPNETLFVVDAMIGEDAVNTAKAIEQERQHRRRGAVQARW